jgi:lipopolysaccharide cholinephosphotransferase
LLLLNTKWKRTMTDFDTLFPDKREEGETPIRQCQLVMLRMFKIFDYLCLKHNIKYFLTGGSLLGAIRHQGFIPWDDDFDIGITRDNYEKFVRLAVPELPYDIFFQTPETDMYYAACEKSEAKIKDKYSTYRLSEAQKKYKKNHQGLQLDLFVYDRAYLPHNVFLYALNRLLEVMFWKVGPNNTNNEKRACVLKFIAKYSPIPLVWASSFIIRRKMIKLGQSYKTNKEIADVLRVKFEDGEAYIPVGWESYLKRMYGDYMKLPPVEMRNGHFQGIPDPFTPCEHSEILYWKDRKLKVAD